MKLLNKSQKTKLSSQKLVAKVPILEKLKGKKAGVFIDDSNIYFAQKKPRVLPRGSDARM